MTANLAGVPVVIRGHDRWMELRQAWKTWED